MPSRRTKWRPSSYEVFKFCPKCGSKIESNLFDNGYEMYCSDYDNCDWEKWVQNPTHSLQGPKRRCLQMEIGRKKLISLSGTKRVLRISNNTRKGDV